MCVCNWQKLGHQSFIYICMQVMVEDDTEKKTL